MESTTVNLGNFVFTLGVVVANTFLSTEDDLVFDSSVP